MATNYHLDFMRAMRTRDYEQAEVIIMEILDYMKKSSSIQSKSKTTLSFYSAMWRAMKCRKACRMSFI